MARILTSRDDFMATVNHFENWWWKIEQSDLSYIPENTIALDAKWEEKLLTIIDILEDDEDVDTVWHNAA
jgi:transcriptional/translational regulatory protein YebC/TACO1